MNKPIDLVLGICGGGQLARMMIPYCKNLGISVRVLDQKDAPAADLGVEWIEGDFQDRSDVMRLGRDADVITIEIENVNWEALNDLEKTGKNVFPNSVALACMRDKGNQKIFFTREKFPTAEYVLVDSISDLKKFKDFGPAFLKLRQGGYDGKGVFPFASIIELEKKWATLKGPVVLEKKINILKELAVVVCRSRDGAIMLYDPVEMVFDSKLNLLDFLWSPARISEELKTQMQTIATQAVRALDYVGVLAIEMFLTPDHKLFVNEAAPRVHNSGHHTIEANQTSQFENHVRAVMGLKLGSSAKISNALTMNLIGQGFGTTCFEGIQDALQIPSVYVHDYGKKLCKDGRKMGHVTILAESFDEAFEKAQKVKRCLRVVGKNK